MQYSLNYFEVNNLFSLDQSGFLSGRTMDDQLLLTYNDITYFLDVELILGVILFDFAKAFDIVSLSMLIDKLNLLRVCGPILD